MSQSKMYSFYYLAVPQETSMQIINDRFSILPDIWEPSEHGTVHGEGYQLVSLSAQMNNT